MKMATNTRPASAAIRLRRTFSAPRLGPIVRTSRISTGRGREPPRSCTSRSRASSALKLPVITAEPPVIPAALNWSPTLASLMGRPSNTMPSRRPVPAIERVSSANLSPPSRLKVSVTSQLLPFCCCWRPAVTRSLPVSSAGSNRSTICSLARASSCSNCSCSESAVPSRPNSFWAFANCSRVGPSS